MFNYRGLCQLQGTFVADGDPCGQDVSLIVLCCMFLSIYYSS